MRLEQLEIEALDRICAAENLTIHEFCERADRDPARTEGTRTARIRMAILAHFKGEAEGRAGGLSSGSGGASLHGSMMEALWAEMMAEPRWLAIVGLALDALGAVLVAATAWIRVTAVTAFGGPAKEESKPMWRRRSFVILGASLLVVGFGRQIWATGLQITQAEKVDTKTGALPAASPVSVVSADQPEPVLS